MLIGSVIQQPGDTLDYDVRYADWLSTGDVVQSATAQVAPVGLTVQSPLVVDSGKTVKVWVSGGVTGTRYKVTLTATTAQGRVVEHELRVIIKDY